MKTRSKQASALSILVIGLLLPFSVSTCKGQTNGRGVVIEKSVKTLPSTAKRYAIVIGVDQYADTQITTLGGASNDAKALAKALVQYAGFPSEQVTLLASDQPAERQP